MSKKITSNVHISNAFSLIRHTISTQIKWSRSNFCPGFFGAVAFKFEPKMTVVIKNLAQKVDFFTKVPL